LEAAFIVAGDFNKANLRTMLPKFYQHIDCTTCRANTLYHCYSNFSDAYKAIPQPPFCKSDHNAILLVPAYRQKLKQDVSESQFNSSDRGRMWQGLQEITDYKNSRVMLPDKLITFFARFEDNTVPPSRLANKYCPPFSFSMTVSKTFKRVYPRKDAGPDSIPSHVLRACSTQSVVPTWFKMSTIVPVPKKAKITELNDYRPVALTSVIMKCFERLVKDHITATLLATHFSLHTAPTGPQITQ
jgi:hypothetical protein